MNRINRTFAQCKQQERKALIGFCTANFPNSPGFVQLLHKLPYSGCDIIEVGMPFSDPIADGPTIQRSNRVALASHTDLSDIFRTIRAWRQTNQHTPMILMGYYNPVLHFGEDNFVHACTQAGVDGVILVDLPPEESVALFTASEQAGIATIRLITPTTTSNRMAYLCGQLTCGFVYYVSVTGVTGVKKAQQQKVSEHVAELRQYMQLPIVVGFGITDTQDAVSMAKTSDGIVVGSALIRAIEQGGVDKACQYVQQLRQALDSN